MPKSAIKQRKKAMLVSDKFKLMRDHIEITEMAYLACVLYPSFRFAAAAAVAIASQKFMQRKKAMLVSDKFKLTLHHIEISRDGLPGLCIVIRV
jgi:hypothetical protein